MWQHTVRHGKAPLVTVEGFDHVVLTVRSVRVTCDFYARVLGMRVVTFDSGRTALAFGSQKINLHEQGAEFEPKAATPTPGSADLCFVGGDDPAAFASHLHACGVAVIEGPVARTGALGPMTSVYFRDPDGNLLEVGHYDLKLT